MNELLEKLATDYAFDLSILAFIISVLAFLRPWIRIKGPIEFNPKDYSFSITICNKNPFFGTIKDIQCEIAISNHFNFSIAKTQDLVKDWIVCLRRCSDDYKFKTTLSERRRYIRVRFLSPNILGIKKVHEIIAEYNVGDEKYEIYKKRGFRWVF